MTGIKKQAPETDSQKIRLIPEIMASVGELYKILITGDVDKGVPGLLETIRNIKGTVDNIAQKQVNIEELERRVRDIEDRHKREDEAKKRMGAYTLATFSIALSNVVMIILWLIGFGR